MFGYKVVFKIYPHMSRDIGSGVIYRPKIFGNNSGSKMLSITGGYETDSSVHSKLYHTKYSQVLEVPKAAEHSIL
jgi:hypothetical protein